MAARGRRIADTSVMRSQNTQHVRILRDMDVSRFVVVQMGDPVDGEICTLMNGTVVEVAAANDGLDEFLAMDPDEQEAELTRRRGLGADERSGDAAMPPFHPNCFPAGTPVSGAFVAGVRMPYVGPMVILQVDSLDPLSVTPNHPVLTPFGFVAAGDLREGDDVLCDGAVSHVEILGDVASDDEHETPARIEDVFDALAARGLVRGVQRARVAPDALHGDAACGPGHVDVVGVERELLDDVGAEQAEGGREGVLVVAAVQQSRGVGDGAGRDLATRHGAATRSGPGGGARSLDGGAVVLAGGPARALRVGASAQLDVSLAECVDELSAADARLAREGKHGLALNVTSSQSVDASDPSTSTRVSGANVLAARAAGNATEQSRHGVPADAVLASKLLDRFAGRVAPRKVISVSRRENWSGHVFDLQAATGHMVAGGIVTSNCLCQLDAEES